MIWNIAWWALLAAAALGNLWYFAILAWLRFRRALNPGDGEALASQAKPYVDPYPEPQP